LQYTSDKQYFVTALGNDYMEIYSTYSNDGYVNGFKTVDANGKVVTNGCSAVGKYTTYVAIHITNPDYAFKPENMLDTDDKYGWLSYEWEITPRELDFVDAKWEYSYDRNNWYDFDADGDPEYTMLGVYVRLSDAYLRSLGLNANSADSVEIIYNDGNRDYNTGYAPFNKKGSNTITAELTINDSNYTLSNNTASKTFEITAKQIKIKWSSSALEFETKDTTSYTWGVTITNTDGVDYSDYIEYTFVFNDKDGNELRLSLDEAREYFKANASSAAEDLINGTVYVSVKADSASDYIITGADLSHSFSVGEGKDTIKVEIEGSGSEYKKVEFSITATFGSSSFTQYLDVEIYSPDSELLDTFKASNASAIREYLNTLDAGNYTFGIVAPDDIAAIYAVRPDVFTFEIAKQNVEAPTVVNSDQIIYKAAEYSIADYLSGFNSELMEIDELHSDTAGKTAKDYTLTINLLDKNNYKFVYPETSATPAKIQVRTALTDGESGSTNMSIASDGSYVDIIWTIQKFVITDSMFSTTTGELKLPAQFNDLLANDLLQVGYQYYADKTSNEPITELKAGETYYVVASLGGESANNFVFENPSLTSETTSQRVTFKSPQSGFSAVLGNLKNFTTKTWLGLPIWAWLLIGLFLLILLIIIIAVACKRRKSKEERAEAKARREEERQLQREKLEAERELAKAKQEAELEKIRAQAGMGMVGAGMATMAMQQPAQQATAQQPAQQPQMQSQSVQQMPIQMPMQMPMQQPVQAAQASGGMNASEMMAMMFAQLAGMKADNADKEIAALKSDKEITALKTEIEIMKLKMEQLKESKSVQPVDGKPELTPEFLGAVIASAMRSNGVLPQTAPVAELPQQISENASVNCEYPPDAVITTTTTVDTTTKPQPRRTERGAKDEFMDVDGFYDKFE
ncbi:MAG: hypothetical protein K2N52_00150, partial [Clostridia bacterium]|nr:hypothetical protein [Clostridia bacterium]